MFATLEKTLVSNAGPEGLFGFILLIIPTVYELHQLMYKRENHQERKGNSHQQLLYLLIFCAKVLALQLVLYLR
jgi:hypothetical protein